MPGIMSRFWLAGILVLSSLTAVPAIAGDWPAWRFDAQRSAASPDELPAKLSLHWVRELPPLVPAWPDQPKMQFDAAYEPVVAGERLFVGSSHHDSVTAYDTRSGRELWTYCANGPVRFAPLVWEGRVYFVADDGYLYCLQADDGSLAWKFRGGPSDRRVLGNERLISTWPARGAPVIADGKIYFAAGIWPFMGIFLHALDARTGELVWTNDGDGSTYRKQPHNADSFAGVAPQGPLVAIGERLLVPGGRSVPACYDRTTGKLLYYQLAENAKRGGGSTVAAAGGLIFNGGSAFDLATEKQLGDIGDFVAFAGDRLFDGEGGKLRELDLPASQVQEEKTIDRKGKAETTLQWSVRELGKAGTPPVTTLIKAGSRLYVGSTGRVLAYDLPLAADGDAKPAWEIEVEGTPTCLIAADDRLFVSTIEGCLYCLGAADQAPASPNKHLLAKSESPTDPAAKSKVEAILKNTSVREGYCVVYGGSPQLVTELARQAPELRIIAIESSGDKAGVLRKQLRSAGIGGRRAAVLVADPTSAELPPYLASLAIVEAAEAAEGLQPEFVASVFETLRPFGGVACLPILAEKTNELAAALEPRKLSGADWKRTGDMTLLARVGPLPDSADWTHEHADAANTRVSQDKRVKAPLGLLWFGGSTNTEILPRHGHGPQPQVVDGRLFIEGMDLIRAVDIYTGRVLWESSLPGVGDLYDNTAHQPGANGSGTNYIATNDGIYVAYQRSCVRLDPATGKQTATYQLPAAPGAKEPPVWGYINVAGDYLVGGADPLFNPDLASSRGDNDNHAFSRKLVVLDRASGTVLWSADARNGFRHNAICIGGGRLYAIDRMTGPELSRLKRRGETPPHGPRLIVFDLASGKEQWSTEKDVFGTWLSYSAEHDVLVEAGRQASDTINDEAKGIRTYRASGGEVVWENKSLSGYALLHHDTLLLAGKACDLLTGELRMREHPLSGEPVEWSWTRNYGCNTPLASEHLLTFRSGAAGYFDLCNDGGTGNFGGFRSSCSNNLIVAGGLITAADYTRTCTCSYQNQSSIALVPMPDVETWTFTGTQLPKQAVRRLGLNLGAPGDRKADDGTLWLEYPSVGGASPAIDVTIEPQEPAWFRRHSSQVSGPGPAWVAASGAKGLTSISIKLAEKDAARRKYTLRLHFAEPDAIQPGERVFSVRVQGQAALTALDVVKETGGPNRSLVKELPGIEVTDRLVIELTPDASSMVQASVLSGIEIQAEGW